MVKIVAYVKEILLDPDSEIGDILYWSLLIYLGLFAFFPGMWHMDVNDLSGPGPFIPRQFLSGPPEPIAPQCAGMRCVVRSGH